MRLAIDIRSEISHFRLTGEHAPLDSMPFYHDSATWGDASRRIDDQAFMVPAGKVWYSHSVTDQSDIGVSRLGWIGRYTGAGIEQVISSSRKQAFHAGHRVEHRAPAGCGTRCSSVVANRSGTGGGDDRVAGAAYETCRYQHGNLVADVVTAGELIRACQEHANRGCENVVIRTFITYHLFAAVL